ncbi:MAG: chromate transporter [Anaerolineales bacterium]|nr:MAG: chromate transporter [Anaerolineales bacterium]
MKPAHASNEETAAAKTRSWFIVDLRLFWIFLKVNLLTTAGPTSVGLLYKETVGKIMTEAQFVEAVGFSNLVPGSEALKLAMFIGYSSGGIPGLLAALLGAIIPPTFLMFTAAFVLVRMEGQEWMKGFIKGMGPAVGVLLTIVAWQLFRAAGQKSIKWRVILIAVLSFIALVFLDIPPQYVLVGAGTLGLFIFR